MRADIVTARTAVAHAAWHGRDRGHQRGHPRRRPARAAAPPPAQPVRRPRPRRGPARPGARRRRPGAGPRAAEPPGWRRRRRRGDCRRRSRDQAPSAPSVDRARTPRWLRTSRSRRLGNHASDDHRRAPARRTGPSCSPSAAPGPARPGKRSRAVTDNGRRIGAARRAARLAPPGRDDPRRGAAPAGARAHVGPAAAPLRGPAGRDPRGPGVQPGAVLRRRLRLDGGAQADGAGQDRDPVAAARRLPAPRQGRAGDVPRRPPPSWRCRRRTRSTSPPRRLEELPAGGRTPLAEGLLEAAPGARARAGPRPAAPPAARRRHRRPRDQRRRRGRALPPGRRAAARRPASPAWSSTARPARCGSAWPRRSPSTSAPSTCPSPRSAPRR